MFKTPYIKVGAPNKALIKSSGSPLVQVSIGNTFKVLPILQRVDQLNLNLRTIIINTKHGITINGVTIHVSSCCQIKIQGWSLAPRAELHQDDSAIRLAAQHFLGKNHAEIDDCIQRTVAGHQRAIISTLTVEQLYRDRESFSKKVLHLCYDDMRNMGLTIVSYTVADISDENGYIEALGVPQIEFVKREAAEGKAFHQARARSCKAEQETIAHLVVNEQERRKFESSKFLAIKKAVAQEAIERELSKLEKTYFIADAQQDTILLVERQKAKAAEVEAELQVMKHRVAKERLVKEQMLHVEADAMLYKATVDADTIRRAAQADAEKTRLVGQANADAEAMLIKERGIAIAEADALSLQQRGDAEADVIRAKGIAIVEVKLAEAEAIKAKGMAQAEVLRERLNMWKECGNQGIIMEKIIGQLPKIAGAVAAPLAKTEKMVFVGSGSSGNDAMQLLQEDNLANR